MTDRNTTLWLMIITFVLIVCAAKAFSADDCTWTICKPDDKKRFTCVTKSGSIVELAEAYAGVDESKEKFSYTCDGGKDRKR